MSADPVSVYEFGPFRVDPVERTLFEGASQVVLTEKVFDLLLLLVQNQGRALGKAELMRSLWPDTVVEENNLTVNISVLRKALGERASERRYIETLARRGYRFVAEVREPLSGAAPSRASLAPSFVGRERELLLLDERLEQARGGQGRLVFITGEPGLGKTALCEQLLGRAEGDAQRPFVARGRCLEQLGAGEAYLPFLEAFRELALGPESGRVVPVLRRHAPTWCAELGLPGEPSEARAAVPEERRGRAAARMLREMGDVIEALSALEPLVLLLEDMHWADPSSCDLLRLLGQRVGFRRVLVLATFRDGEVEVEHHPLRNVRRELYAHDQCEELRLPLLDRAAIGAYLDARFEPHQLPAELGELIANTTEGHPLFITRLVQLLVDRGDIQQVGGRFELARPVVELTLGVPQSVRGLIQRKLESLDEEGQRALQYASVIGVEFNSAGLASLLALDEVLVEERLDQLARPHKLLELLGEERLSSGRLTLRYRFSHVLYRNVLYDELAAKRRMLLHESAAAHLLAENAGNESRVAAQLALHYEAARDFERAVEHLMVAADNASRIFAIREAKQYYGRALALCAELGPAAQLPLSIILHYNHVWVAVKLGDSERAIAEAEAMLRLAGAPEFAGEGSAAERARERVFDYFAEPWRDAFGVNDMPRMPNQDRSMGAGAIQCEAYGILAHLHYQSGKLDELAVQAAALLTLADATSNQPRRAEALAWLAVRELELRNLDAATRHLDRGLPVARAANHDRALFLLNNTRGRIHYLRGEYEQAEAAQVEGLPLSFEVSGRVEFLIQIGLVRGHLGRLSEALAVLSEARDIARRTELGTELQIVTNLIGWVHLESGDSDRALEESMEGVALAERAGSRGAAAHSWLQLARAHVEQGNGRQAQAALERARGLFGEGEGARGLRRNLGVELVQGEWLLAQGQPGEAAQVAVELLPSAERLASPKHLALARLLGARARIALGAHGLAEREARAGLLALSGRPLPIVGWKLCLVLGEALRGMGDGAGALVAFAEAREMVERIEVGLEGGRLRAVCERAER